jgi:predicted metal-dependent phosphoesterase TrpH
VIFLYKKGDFHLHTTASDGRLSPGELVDMASKEGMDIIAVTDHDTVSGIDEALEAGKKAKLKIIPGIELSTLYQGNSVHVLGYFEEIHNISSEFKNFLEKMSEYRKKRAEKIVDNLYKFFNIKLDYEKIIQDAHNIVTRPHIAQAIIDAGYNYTFKYIFTNFIGDSCPAFVPNKKLSTQEGIELLKSLNALVVLAHPVLIKNVNVEELLHLPFDGIEAIYSMNTSKDTDRFIKYAEKYNKIITAGSDFHGLPRKNRDDPEHSHSIGEVYLDEEKINIFLNKLKDLSKK